MPTPMFPPHIVGVIQGIAGLLLLLFLKPALNNLDTVGSRSFVANIIGTSMWIFGLAAGNLTGNYTLSVVAWQCVMLGAKVAAVAWFMLALEVTNRTNLARKLLPWVAAVVIVTHVVAFTNPLHHLFLGPDTSIEGMFLRIDYGIGFWIHYWNTVLFALVAIGIFVFETVRTTGLQRKQAALFALATVPVMLTDFLTFFTDIFDPYNITPFGYVITAVLLFLVLFKGRFLDITPVARRTAMAEMNDAMVTVDEENRVIDANRRARELFDIDDDYIGMPAADFFQPVQPDILAEFESGTVTNAEISVDLDGQQRHFSLSISRVGEHSSKGRVVLLHDITDQKHREQKLHRQNERLDKFASVVSHDLRNPLGIAEMYLNFAEESGDPEDFEAVDEALDRMDTMIDDLLMIARADTTVESREEIDLESLATDGWETAQTNGGTIQFDLDPNTTVNGDRELLRNVFENLFRNALDHNELPVKIRVGTLNGEESGFYVEDDGEGIHEADREKIFEYGHTTSEDGSGFGLHIVRELVTAHDWEISVTTGSDGGARFEVYTGSHSV